MVRISKKETYLRNLSCIKTIKPDGPKGRALVVQEHQQDDKNAAHEGADQDGLFEVLFLPGGIEKGIFGFGPYVGQDTAFFFL